MVNFADFNEVYATKPPTFEEIPCIISIPSGIEAKWALTLSSFVVLTKCGLVPGINPPKNPNLKITKTRWGLDSKTYDYTKWPLIIESQNAHN